MRNGLLLMSVVTVWAGCLGGCAGQAPVVKTGKHGVDQSDPGLRHRLLLDLGARRG